jgi:hypothetical protein
MANSGIAWVDIVFDYAVQSLYWTANLLGISYEEINVWLFCIAWPALTVLMAAAIVALWRANRRLKRRQGFDLPPLTGRF